MPRTGRTGDGRAGPPPVHGGRWRCRPGAGRPILEQRPAGWRGDRRCRGARVARLVPGAPDRPARVGPGGPTAGPGTAGGSTARRAGAGAPVRRPEQGDAGSAAGPGGWRRARPTEGPQAEGGHPRVHVLRRRRRPPFEPDWRGASWYGTTSGTYWTLNPKEYADPRKHGPEYQARARRATRSRSRARHRRTPAGATDAAAGAPDLDAAARGRRAPASRARRRPTPRAPGGNPRPARPARTPSSRPASSHRAAGAAGPAARRATPPPDIGRAMADIGRALTDERLRRDPRPGRPRHRRLAADRASGSAGWPAR